LKKNSAPRNCLVWAFERNSDSKEPLGLMKEPAKTRQGTAGFHERTSKDPTRNRWVS